MTQLIRKVIRLMEMLPYSILALLGRFAVGLVFWNSARTKVQGWDLFHVNENTLTLFTEEYKLPIIPPEIAALMAQLAEHTFSVLIIVGLATRFSALGLLVMTLVIEVFVYPDAYVVHGTWAAILMMLIKFGPGGISLDRFIRMGSDGNNSSKQSSSTKQ
jgi:putative oxidoreductase